jgi:hypothetical protein
MSQVIVGFTTEGPSDERFLASVLERTFEEISFECEKSIEIFPLEILPKGKGEFIIRYEKLLEQAFHRGLMVLCIHVDADNSDDTSVFKTRFNPLFDILAARLGQEICEVVVPIVPIQMTESWMLADLELLKDELGTNLSDFDLGLHRRPESISDPKEVIRTAIRIANESRSKRHRNALDIAALYQLIGRKIDLKKLRNLKSYIKFEEAVRSAYRQLNYLQ